MTVILAASPWIPVVGTLGGVAVGSLGTWMIERGRWKREDQTRWYADRRQVYARFLQAASSYRAAGYALLSKIDEARVRQEAGETVVQADMTAKELESFHAALKGLGGLYYEILLVGGAEAVNAARRMIYLGYGTAWTGETTLDAEEQQKALQGISEAAFDFRRAARAEIGLSSDAPEVAADG